MSTDLYKRLASVLRNGIASNEPREAMLDVARRLEEMVALAASPAIGQATLREAVQFFFNALDRRHDQNDPPQKYTVPWGAVNALRAALLAFPDATETPWECPCGYAWPQETTACRRRRALALALARAVEEFHYLRSQHKHSITDKERWACIEEAARKALAPAPKETK